MDVVQKALLSCSESLVLGHGHGLHREGSAAGPQDILMASMGHLLLKDVKDVGLFQSLRICSLPDNFITTIDALAECALLVKLDLKGNQVSSFRAVCHRPIVIVRLQYVCVHVSNAKNASQSRQFCTVSKGLKCHIMQHPLSPKGII